MFLSVSSVLLQGGANVNSQDFDGWTPLHAAAHWGQKEACEMLVEEFCDMDMKNYVVGNYQFISFTEVGMSSVHSENSTVDKIYKCTGKLYATINESCNLSSLLL